MTNFDDRITEALRDIPTAPQRPLADIEARKRAHGRRRTAAVGVGVLAAGGLLALPAGSLLGGRDTVAETAASPEAPACPTAPWEISPERLSEWDRLGGLEEVPDELRLLWPEPTAPAPTSADASLMTAIVPFDEYLESCSVTQHEGALIYLDDDEVTTRIWIQYTSVPYEHPPGRGGEPSPVKRVIPTDDGGVGVWHGEPGKDILNATWGTDEESWGVVTEHPLTDDELAGLADAARFADGAIRLGGWSVLSKLPTENDAGRLVQSSLSARAPEIYNLDVQLSGGGTLMTRTSSDDLLNHANPGDRLIEFDGQQALLRRRPAEDSHPGSVAVLWKPSTDVLANVSADAGQDERVLEIARSLEQVPADDPRLVSVWRATSP